MSELTQATAETKALTAALEEARARLKLTKDAIAEEGVAVEKNAALTLELRRQALALSRDIGAMEAGLKATAEASKQLSAAQQELATKQERLGALSAKAFSEELPEKIKDAKEAYRLFGDEQLTTGERARALGASLSIGKTVLAGYAGAVTGAVSSLIQMSEAARAAEVRLEQQREVISALGPAMGAVRDATGGAASATDAWAARNALLGAGLRVTSEQLATVVEGARRHREAGESNADSINRVVAAISGEHAAQERLGMVTRTGADAQERLAEVLGRLAGEHQRLGAAAETAAERQARQTTNIQRAQDGVLSTANEMFNPLHQLLAAGGSAVEIFDRASVSAREWRTGQVEAAHASSQFSAALDPVKQRIRETANAQNDANSAIDAAKAKTDAAAAAMRAYEGTLEAGRLAMKHFQQQTASVSFAALPGETHDAAVARNVAAGRRAMEAQIRTRTLGNEVRDRLLSEGQGNRASVNAALGLSDPSSSGTRTEPKWVIAQGYADAYREAERLAQIERRLTAQAQVDTNVEAERVALIERRLNAQAQVDANIERQRIELEAMQTEHARGGVTQTDEGLLGKVNASAQLEADNARAGDFGAQLRDNFTSTATVAQRSAQDVKGAVDAMSGAFASHVDALISGREEAGAAFLGMAADASKAVAMQSVPKAIAYAAEGIAYSVTAPPLAPPMFAAAGMHAGVALAFGATAAGLGALQASNAQAAAPPSNNAGQGSPARGSELGSGRNEGGPVIHQYNFNGLVTETQAARTLARVQNRGARAGIRPTFAERR